ncbi:MAG: Lrp/AsnC ligand binding domain-containing protein [Candidatus Caldarchaeum sp.]|nr:Lrp/AsnC ligand binding domain-containing protein [Candidatus Caldarchaeum sp.]MCS7133680.1 Lrp/AsnC ligand binding domain-containing protein [Candidatus Caldarchaeum sp.]MCX8201574.1 Lrp/AsnC ligand binding domain-containing protein [Candidatus Caldarchaeum sp.]MDW8062890.1 Lrp/AsnC ligand binding domain-containing protein [Candidatus Caldarchaeum sp.]MDW8435024.1 Lrp/AsnC ligand binding domain-containing protein [Candidatus Caldarchaeum sp.]
MKAFVLGTVGTRSGLIETITSLRNDKNIEESYLIWGPYDVLSKVSADSLKHLNSILDAMRAHGVVDTNTLIVNEGGLSFEKEGAPSRRKCAYIFVKMRRPSAPKLWEKYLMSIDEILEGHELFGMWDVVVSVAEEARDDFFNRVFKRLWLLTEVNMTSTHTMFTVKE